MCVYFVGSVMHGELSSTSTSRCCSVIYPNNDGDVYTRIDLNVSRRWSDNEICRREEDCDGTVRLQHFSKYTFEVVKKKYGDGRKALSQQEDR